MSGVQALVRLPMLQRSATRRRAEHGRLHQRYLWLAARRLRQRCGCAEAPAANTSCFQPASSEELGATAVWGTQQLDLYPQTKKFDGVFGIWYGKGPGVDRCSTSSSTPTWPAPQARRRDRDRRRRPRRQELTAAHQSDHIFKACGLPVFFPSSVQDILDMGLHAFALSRFAGVWSA
jgi:indolepyruvate ferredoxin oxidoreductase